MPFPSLTEDKLAHSTSLNLSSLSLAHPTGPGGLAKAYLELPNVKKVICIEDAFRYRPFLDVSVAKPSFAPYRKSRS